MAKKNSKRSGSEPDLGIIGRGILGLNLAVLAAERGQQVTVFSLPEQIGPTADSQRNHAWQQSGLLYEDDLPAALRMPSSGEQLLRHFGMKPSTERGVFGYKPEDVPRFLEHAKRLGLSGAIEKMSEAEQRRELKGFFAPGRVAYRVPDAPFDEGTLLTRAYMTAVAAGVKFVEAPVRLVPDPGAENGFFIEAAGVRYSPGKTAVCAGGGTKDILAALGINVPLRVDQSPLLVYYTDADLRVPLWVDRATDLAVVRWHRRIVPPKGRIVVGDRQRRTIANVDLTNRERVTGHQYEKLRAQLPYDVRNLRCRRTSGYKTEVTVEGRRTVDSWFMKRHARFPSLFAAVPGKATLSYDAAQRLLLQMGIRPSNSEEPGTVVVIGADVKKIPMHFEPSWDELDEFCEDNNDNEEEN